MKKIVIFYVSIVIISLVLWGCSRNEEISDWRGDVRGDRGTLSEITDVIMLKGVAIQTSETYGKYLVFEDTETLLRVLDYMKEKPERRDTVYRSLKLRGFSSLVDKENELDLPLEQRLLDKDMAVLLNPLAILQEGDLLLQQEERGIKEYLIAEDGTRSLYHDGGGVVSDEMMETRSKLPSYTSCITQGTSGSATSTDITLHGTLTVNKDSRGRYSVYAESRFYSNAPGASASTRANSLDIEYSYEFVSGLRIQGGGFPTVKNANSKKWTILDKVDETCLRSLSVTLSASANYSGTVYVFLRG